MKWIDIHRIRHDDEKSENEKEKRVGEQHQRISHAGRKSDSDTIRVQKVERLTVVGV